MECISQELKQAVLQAAVQGKLTQQIPEDGNAKDLLSQVKERRTRLIEKKIIKKEKPFEQISEDDIPFDIPQNWEWVKLPEILSIQPSNGKSATAVEFNTGIKNLTLTATTSGIFNSEAYKYVNLDIDSASQFWLHPGDLLIQRSNSRELVGTSCIFDGNDNEFIYPDLMMRMRVMEPINLNYVDYVLKSPFVKSYYSNSASGTSDSMPKINQGIVCNTMIPVPPLAEQQRIASRVKELIAKIDELKIIENEICTLRQNFLNDMKSAILHAAMQGKLTEQFAEEGSANDILKTVKKRTFINIDSTPFDIPQNWEWAILNDVADMYTGNSISETEKNKNYTGLENGYDYIATKDVNFAYGIQYDNGVRIPYDNKKFRHAFANSTLLCIEGGSAGRKIAMLDRDVCFGNKLCMFYSKLLDNKFLFYYLQSPCFQAAFKNNVTGIIGGVSIKKIKSMMIPVPPLAEQQRIVAKLDKLLTKVNSLVY